MEKTPLSRPIADARRQMSAKAADSSDSSCAIS
jgi:hypothetical protein